MVVKTYMDMDQDSEEEKQQYLGLALHLASEFFLRNPNKDVRLLVACCLADIFRIYAPEAPYTSHDKLKARSPLLTAVLILHTPMRIFGDILALKVICASVCRTSSSLSPDS